MKSVWNEFDDKKFIVRIVALYVIVRCWFTYVYIDPEGPREAALYLNFISSNPDVVGWFLSAVALIAFVLTFFNRCGVNAGGSILCALSGSWAFTYLGVFILTGEPRSVVYIATWGTLSVICGVAVTKFRGGS